MKPDQKEIEYPIYLDYNATTPLDPRVLEAMIPYFSETFGNPASIDHHHGASAAEAVEEARGEIAKCINAKPEEIVFTSGATESDNLALVGIMDAHEAKGNHLITCQTEHPAVLETAQHLESKGNPVTYLKVDRYGLVDPEDVVKAITPETVLISIMMANNEIGTIAPVMEIGYIAHQHGVFFHTDAAQAIGKIPVDVQSMGIDLLSISGHKIYGPKGIGALYVRRRNPYVKIHSILHGGEHERGIRSGTLNTPGIVGLAKALEICCQEMDEESKRLRDLSCRFFEEIKKEIPDIELNGHPELRIPNCINLYIPGVENRALISATVDKLSFSAGSACATNKAEPSYVLTELEFSEERSYNSIRLSLGRWTTEKHIQNMVTILSAQIKSIQTKFKIG